MSWDMYPDAAVDYFLKEGLPGMSKETCNNCSADIEVAIFKGTGWCSENCRKALAHERPESRSQVDAGITGFINQPTGTINPKTIT